MKEKSLEYQIHRAKRFRLAHFECEVKKILKKTTTIDANHHNCVLVFTLKIFIAFLLLLWLKAFSNEKFKFKDEICGALEIILLFFS